jgi:hypothetical protein
MKPDEHGEHRGAERGAELAHMRNRRLSTMSMTAPAGMASRKTDRVAATWTNETIRDDCERLVMSQPHAAAYIQLPMLATSVASQITAKGL